MPDVMSTLKRNLDKRVDNIKGLGNDERRALEQMVDDLKDLEVVEGPYDFINNTGENLSEAQKQMFRNNKDLFDGLEQSVSGSADFSIRDFLGGR